MEDPIERLRNMKPGEMIQFTGEEVQKIKDFIAKQAFGQTQGEAKEAGVCIKCRKTPGLFRDALSKEEWRISSLCQECQDQFF